jgi:D-aminopeptidase
LAPEGLGRARARDLGIRIGRLEPGERNAITDVPGVRVGHTTLISGEGPLRRGSGPIRTGVTLLVPHDGDVWSEPVFAGAHRLNGNGEMTGVEWIRESGLLGGAIAITNTHSVGVVHDALVAAATRERRGGDVWSLPVVGETYDGTLNDIDGFHVRPEHVHTALESAAGGPVAEGNVGGGTGMICHEFKGGIGTASRRVGDGWTLGVLVQANYGRRELLRIDGVPVGAEIGRDEVPSPWDDLRALPRRVGPDAGSIIAIVATDAPLLPHQCERVAQRVSLGLGRMGSYAANSSGDLFLAFATGNRGLTRGGSTVDVRMVADTEIDSLFEATAEATEEAIVNALVAAQTMTGRDGITAHALDHERLLEVMRRYGRGPNGSA